MKSDTFEKRVSLNSGRRGLVPLLAALAAAWFAGTPQVGAAPVGSNLFDADFRDYTLTVASDYGNPTPPAGITNYAWCATVTCGVEGLVGDGGTNRLCAGWIGTGSVPSEGTTASTGPFVLTNVASSIAWQWQTRYLLATATNGNGTVTMGGWQDAGSNVTLTATAAANYHFAGWSGDTNGCGIAGNALTAPMTQARSVTAGFAIDTYEVAFDLGVHGTRTGGGDLAQTIAHGAAATAPEVRPEDGWIFDGWDATFDDVTGPLTVRAQYAQILHTLAVASAHGAAEPAVGVHTNAWGTGRLLAVASPDTQGATQYVCTGWAGTGSVPPDGGTTNVSITITNDSSVVWGWATNHWLEVATVGNGGVDSASGWFAASSNVTVTATPSANWHFAGWSGDTNGCGSAGNVLTAPMTQARAVTASFAIDTYTVAFELGAHGARTGGGELTQTIAHGAAATAPEVRPQDGWTFAGWDVAFDNVTGPLTVRAQYARVVSTLSVVSLHGGATPGTVMADWGTHASQWVTNSPVLNGATQHVCVAGVVTGNDFMQNSATNVTLTLTNNATLTWQWRTSHLLTTTTEGNGTVAADGWFDTASNAVLVAVAEQGWHLARWTGDTDGCVAAGNTLTAPMTQARSVTAVFEVNTKTPVTVYDLKTQFSTTSNPNGRWSYVWNYSPITQQDAYHFGGWGSIPSHDGTIFKCSSAGGHDMLPYDIQLHTLSQNWYGGGSTFVGVLWTSPEPGYIALKGRAWDGAFGDRDAGWTLRAGGDLKAQRGSVRGLYRNDASAQFANNVVSGKNLSAIPVTAGTVVAWHSQTTTAWGSFMGVDLTVAFSTALESAILVESPVGTNLLSGASALDLGMAVVGAGGQTQTVTIRNSGTKELIVSGVAVDGAAADDFVVNTAGMAMVVAPWGVTTFTVTFAPTAADGRNATLRIVSDDPVEFNFAVGLSGAGLPNVDYGVSVDSAHGACIPPVGVHSYACGTDVTCLVSGVERVGATQYVCTGWAGTGSAPLSGSSTNVTFMLTNETSIVWLWQTQYQLSTATTGNGTVTDGGWFDQGSNATLTASAMTDWHFAGWLGDTNGCTITGSVLTAPMTEARTITATFERDPVTLTVVSEHGGASPGTLAAEYGTLLSQWVMNSPVLNGATRYVCVAGVVTGNDFMQNSATNVTLTLTNNAVLSWPWATEYRLTTTASGHGQVSGGNAWVRSGSNATVTATAMPDFHFVEWTGDTGAIVGGDVSNATATVVVDGPVSLTATFAVNHDFVTPSLLLWLKADAIQGLSNGQGIGSWSDLSPYGRSVTPYRAAPTLATSLLNGKPAVRFNGLTSFQVPDSPDWRLQNLTIFAVARRDTPWRGDDWWSGIMMGQDQGAGANPKWSMGFNSSASRNVFSISDNSLGSVATSFSLPFTQFGLFELHKDGARKEGYFGGRLTESSDTAGTGRIIDVATPLYIGFWETIYDGAYYTRPLADSGFHGYIAELLIFNAALSEESRQEVGSYLAEKYGFANAYTLPAFSRHPSSQTVPAGTNALFTVEAFGTAPLDFQWLFDGAALDGETNRTLTVYNVQTPVAGAYRVVANNPLGTVTSSVATLFIAYPPTILTQPTNQTVRIGQPAVFSVLATGTPAPTYQWRLNGTNVTGATGATLTRSPSTPAHLGVYVVAVSNLAGTIISEPATLAFVNTLSVASDHGVAEPTTGTNTYAWGSSVECRVSGVETLGTTQHVCTGWTGTGSVPPSGETTNVTFVITNDSSIVWNWATEYYVEAGTGTGGGGAVTGGDVWVEPGGYVVLTATPEAGYRFWRWTDGAGNVLGFDGVYTNWVVGAGTVTGWFLSLPVAMIDAVEPGEPFEGVEIALSGHGSGEYAVTGYSWSVERLVEGVPDGQARVFCNSASAVTQLAAGEWRISFQVCDTMESWSAPVTRDVTVARAAGLTDLQVSRGDVRIERIDGIERIGGIETGSVVTVTVAVHNTGSAETPGPVRVTLYEGFGPTNLASQVPGALVAVATGTVAHVAAGGVETVALTWTVAGPDGPRTLTVVAEYAENYETAVSNGVNGLSEPLPVTERTLANNLASAMIAVGDLALPPNLLDVTVQAGTMYAGRTGTVAGRAVYGWGQAYPALGALVEVEVEGVSYVTTTRSPDGSFAVSLTAPAVGVHTATARVYDGFAVGSASCTFSCVPYPSGGGGGGYWPPSAPATAPNLVVDAVSIGGSGAYEAESGVPHVRSGGDVVVQALVRNASGFACGDGFEVAFGAGGAPLGTTTVADGLGANEARWVAAPALWGPTTVGTVTVTAEADSGCAVAELSEYDNARSQAVAVREPRPDLRPYRIVWNGNGWSRSSGLSWSPADPVVGDELGVVATVYNCGTLPSGQPFDVALLCDGVQVGRSTVAESIGVGASMEVAFPWSTASVPPGIRTLSLVVDAAGEVSEDYESNNATARSLRLYPDAAAPVPYDLTASPYPTVGDPCVLTVRIRNDGGAAYPGGTAAFYTESPVHTPIGEGAAGAIAMKGGEGAASVAWTPGATGPVRVYVAVEGRVYSEVFNVGEIPPDLRVLSEDIALDPGSPRAGDDVRVRASVRNASAAVAATNVCVTFEIAVGGGVYAQLGAPRWLGALAPGESRTVDAGAVLAEVGRGLYLVRVALDAAGQGDADGGDNAATRSFGVELPVADAGADRACVLGQTVTLDGGGSSNASNWLWRVTSAPSGSVAGLAGADTATPAFTPDVGGNYRIALTVGAGGAASVPDEVAVCVTGVVITASAGAHGAVAPSGTVVVATGSRPMFALTPESGYRVAEVWVDGESAAAAEVYTFAPVILNHTLEARFAVASNTLTVVSAHGTADPAAGTHTFAWGSSVASRVSGVAMIGATQYVCVGWAGTGSIAPHGATTNVTVALTNDSVIVWQWATNYWLEVTTSGSGTVAGVTGYLSAGSDAVLEATAGAGFVFAQWTGDLAGCVVCGTTVTARMDRARALLASFRPLAVTALTAQVLDLDRVQLAWAYSGLSDRQFRIDRQVDGGAWATLGVVAATAFTDQTVAEGLNLRYRVVAQVGGFESAGVEVAVQVPHLPAAPTGVGATAVSAGEVVVYWSPAARATGYTVQRRSVPLGNWATVATLGEVAEWMDCTVAGGARYAYRVRSVNAAGNSAFSVEVTVTVPAAPGEWGYSLVVSNAAITVAGQPAAPGGRALCGATVGGVFDAWRSNPDGVQVQHRVAVGLRDTNGVPAGAAVEINELTGVPPQPPVWVTGALVPEGLRLPALAGTYVLWAEDCLDAGDPREAFANTVRTNETGLARILGAFAAAPPDADDAFVQLGAATARAGEHVAVPITVGAMGGENAFSFSLAYAPSQLAFVGLTPGAAMASCLLEVNDATEGAVGALMLLPVNDGLEPGLQMIATAEFEVDPALAAGTVIDIAFDDQPAFRLVVDAYANLLPHLWYDGRVTVAAAGYEADVFPRGKPNDRVDDKDKAQILRYAAGIDQPAAGDEFQRADCAPLDTRGDGRVDVRDVVIAGRYASGFEALKGVGGPTAPISASSLAAVTVLATSAARGAPDLAAASPEQLAALGLAGLVRLDASYGERGAVLEVLVCIVSGGNIVGASFSVCFDPNELSFLEATASPATAGALCVVNAAGTAAGTVGYVLRMAADMALPKGDVQILTLRFRVAPGAGDAVTLIAFAAEPTAVVLSDWEGASISASVQGASVYLLPMVEAGAPEAVGDLTAVPEQGTRVRLSWSDVSGESGYAVYRRSALEVWGLLAELPADAQGYVDGGLEPGTTYTYRIMSANAVGENWSDPVFVTLPTRYRHWADVNIGIAMSAPRDDYDGDGFSNYLEHLMGTDPTIPDRGLLQTGFRDVYGLGETYFTLAFDVQSWAVPYLVVQATDDLMTGEWVPAAEVGNEAVGGRRRLIYRIERPISECPSQFIRLRTSE